MGNTVSSNVQNVSFNAPKESMVDETINVSVSNLLSGQEVEIKATYIDVKEDKWVSSATFKANEKGIVSLRDLAPINGTYSGKDPMGLFWSMEPEKQVALSYANIEKQDISFEVFSQSQKVAEATIVRNFFSQNVEKREVRDNGLVGTMFVPKGKGPFPGVMVVPGLQGGIPENIASLLASKGFVAFALAYHGIEGTPPFVQNIPMEYFQKAVTYLKSEEKVDVQSMGFFGNSKGSELGLLYSSMFPDDFQAIVSVVPPTINLSSLNPFDLEAAWHYKNSAVEPYFDGRALGIPELMADGTITKREGTYADPLSMKDLYVHKIAEDATGYSECAIKVEKIKANVLMISAEDDQTIPSTQFCEDAQKRLVALQSKIEHIHVACKDAGHPILFGIFPNGPSKPLPFEVPGAGWFGSGGTKEGNAKAVRDAYAKTVAFFNKHLKGMNG